jgi:hypothetical protein
VLDQLRKYRRKPPAWLALPTLDPPPASDDVDDATVRYLMYGLLPGWFVPGVADWLMHRRSAIEHTAGTRESVIHALMMAEVGVPVTLVLTCEINPLVLAVMIGAVAAHEVTALWDVQTAEHSGRRVTVMEQHIHSFLEALPFMATSSLMCLHWDQLRELARAVTGRQHSARAWRLRPRRRRLPLPYLAGVGASLALFIALPYGEELLRCARASRARSRRS